MAGAGYKLFNTGDVLTAAQVNTYLMEQSVMVFADAAARTTALTGVVAEGMLSYLKDTNAVEVYNGSAWVSSDDPNAIQNTIVDAKGDLITATAADTPARLAVGNSGETLVADSAATTGLRWQGNYAAGKNLVMNSNCNISQRGTSFAAVNNDYTVDRFNARNSGLGAFTVSQETDAPTGFKTSAKWLCTTADASPAAADFALYRQYFEGQALQILKKGSASAVSTTLSFWVKSNLTGTFIVNLRDEENTRTISKSYTISSANTWEKKTVNFAGDTTGTLSNDTGPRFSINWFIGVGSDRSSGTLDTTWAAAVNANVAVGQTNVAAALNDYWQITGVQWEIGNTATEWQLMTGTLQGELAACQRYYWRVSGSTASNVGLSTVAFNGGTTPGVRRANIPLPTTMRVRPTLAIGGTHAIYTTGLTNLGLASLSSSTSNTNFISVDINLTSGGTNGQAGWWIIDSNSANDFLEASAEL